MKPKHRSRWLVIAAEEGDHIARCSCCDSILLEFGAVSVQMRWAEFILLSDLLRQALETVRIDVRGGSGRDRSVRLVLPSAGARVRLTVDELERMSRLFAAAWGSPPEGGFWPAELIN